MGKKDKKIDFHKVVKDKKIPILTIDNRWHEIFTDDQKSSEIKELEEKVNNLLKKQGKMVNDIKDMKRLKSDLLKDIVVNMDIGSDIVGKTKEKKLDKNKQYINELNTKIDTSMDDLADVPYQIKEANEALMEESIKYFYEQIEMNKVELKEVADWITEIREELKKKILIKQDLEAKNAKIYSYMHDIFGAELMEAFDTENNKK